MPNGQKAFTFELNESLYFEKGQEVAEMLNISLDPEISIESFNDYISIRGVVELEGEYERVVQEESVTKELEDSDGSSAYRYIERIEDSADGRAMFSHRFPVEISIPSYRITNINDIRVSIDSFDYEIPSENQLKLTSIIKIEGIREQISKSDDEEQDDEEALEPGLLDQRFEFDIKKEEEQKEKTEEVTVDPVHRAQNTEDEQTDKDLTAKDNIGDEEKDRWKYKETKTFEEFFKSPNESEAMEEQEVFEEVIVEAEEVIEEIQEEHPEAEEDIVAIGEDINYLSDMFRSDEEGEQKYSQVRICIVQEKDTMETIAERYNIPQSKIMKLNMLEDDELVEGQLLSIPKNM